jgi:hypothetical protein
MFQDQQGIPEASDSIAPYILCLSGVPEDSTRRSRVNLLFTLSCSSTFDALPLVFGGRYAVQGLLEHKPTILGQWL